MVLSLFSKNKITASHLAEEFNIVPVMYLNPTPVEYQGKTIITIQVPASSQVHDHAGRIYIREYETELDVTGNQHTISGLFLKKRTIYTETHIYPGLKMSDMNESLFEKARNLIYSNRADHPWLSADNMQMLRDAVLYWNDYENQREGFSLMEGDRRIDLRDKIFREVIGNIICHREYTDGTATELLIEEDAVHTLNPNNPYFHGIMDLNNFNPHPKNPNIRKFFTALGRVSETLRNTYLAM